MQDKKLTKVEAGRLGGLRTLAVKGRDHFVRAGRMGAAVTWSRYKLEPVNQSQYAMVHRETNKIIAIR